jgi:hypothetical protein
MISVTVELVELLSHRVPPGVDEAAYVKATYLSALAKGEEECAELSRTQAIELLGTMQGGYNVPLLLAAERVTPLEPPSRAKKCWRPRALMPNWSMLAFKKRQPASNSPGYVFISHHFTVTTLTRGPCRLGSSVSNTNYSKMRRSVVSELLSLSLGSFFSLP